MKLSFRRKKRGSPFPQVSHTKGYYRFSKDFPSVTDSEGYRDNDLIINSPAKKTSVRRKLILLFICVFVISFAGTALCISLSELPVKENQETVSGDTVQTATLSGNKAAFLEGDVLASQGIESILGAFRTENINAVVIEFKDAEGFFYFRPSIRTSAEAVSKASDNAQKVINEFRDAGIKVYASVSCFADDIYARNHQDHTAYVISEPESGSNEKVRSIWYAGENGENAWLSPFSDEVLYYLNTVISDIDALGVDGIILANAVIPLSAENDNVKFEFAALYEETAREKTAQWIEYTLASVTTDTGIEISQAQLLDAAGKTKTDPALKADCDFIVLDAGISDAKDGTVIGNKQYLAPAKTPVEYTQALLTLAADFFTENDGSVQIIPVIDDDGNAGTLVSAVAQLNNDKINSCIVK